MLSMMRFFAFAFAALLAGLTSAQLGTLPSCASDCVTQYTTGSQIGGCNSIDIVCICKNQNFLSGIACCLEGKCSASDQQAATNYAIGFCKLSGVTGLPTAVSAICTATSATSSASFTSSPAPTSTSSAAGVTSANSSVSSAESSASSSGSEVSLSVSSQASLVSSSVSSVSASISSQASSSISSAAASATKNAGLQNVAGLGAGVIGGLAAAVALL